MKYQIVNRNFTVLATLELRDAINAPVRITFEGNSPGSPLGRAFLLIPSDNQKEPYYMEIP